MYINRETEEDIYMPLYTKKQQEDAMHNHGLALQYENEYQDGMFYILRDFDGLSDTLDKETVISTIKERTRQDKSSGKVDKEKMQTPFIAYSEHPNQRATIELLYLVYRGMPLKRALSNDPKAMKERFSYAADFHDIFDRKKNLPADQLEEHAKRAGAEAAKMTKFFGAYVKRLHEMGNLSSDANLLNNYQELKMLSQANLFSHSADAFNAAEKEGFEKELGMPLENQIDNSTNPPKVTPGFFNAETGINTITTISFMAAQRLNYIQSDEVQKQVNNDSPDLDKCQSQSVYRAILDNMYNLAAKDGSYIKLGTDVIGQIQKSPEFFETEEHKEIINKTNEEDVNQALYTSALPDGKSVSVLNMPAHDSNKEIYLELKYDESQVKHITQEEISKQDALDAQPKATELKTEYANISKDELLSAAEFSKGFRAAEKSLGEKAVDIGYQFYGLTGNNKAVSFDEKIEAESISHEYMIKGLSRDRLEMFTIPLIFMKATDKNFDERIFFSDDPQSKDKIKQYKEQFDQTFKKTPAPGETQKEHDLKAGKVYAQMYNYMGDFTQKLVRENDFGNDEIIKNHLQELSELKCSLDLFSMAAMDSHSADFKQAFDDNCSDKHEDIYKGTGFTASNTMTVISKLTDTRRHFINTDSNLHDALKATDGVQQVLQNATKGYLTQIHQEALMNPQEHLVKTSGQIMSAAEPGAGGYGELKEFSNPESWTEEDREQLRAESRLLTEGVLPGSRQSNLHIEATGFMSRYAEGGDSISEQLRIDANEVIRPDAGEFSHKDLKNLLDGKSTQAGTKLFDNYVGKMLLDDKQNAQEMKKAGFNIQDLIYIDGVSVADRYKDKNLSSESWARAMKNDIMKQIAEGHQVSVAHLKNGQSGPEISEITPLSLDFAAQDKSERMSRSGVRRLFDFGPFKIKTEADKLEEKNETRGVTEYSISVQKDIMNDLSGKIKQKAVQNSKADHKDKVKESFAEFKEKTNVNLKSAERKDTHPKMGKPAEVKEQKKEEHRKAGL